MGCGIWSMHFIGMLAMETPFIIEYNTVITAISLLAAIVFSACSFFVIHKLHASKRTYLIGGSLLASGIASMHYIGMAAIEQPVTVSYNYNIVHLSAVVALVVSFLALMQFFSFKQSSFKSDMLKKIMSSMVMGGGIAAVHYIGMEAATLHVLEPILSNSNNHELVISITIIVFLILAGGSISILMDENISAKDKIINLENQFIQAQKMEAVGTLVGGIAHDFNNILAAITGSVFLAKRASNPEKHLVNIETQTERASNMVKQLLAFARKDIRKMEPLCLNKLVRETVQLFKMTTPENIQINIDLCASKQLVSGDFTQLQQVLVNFVNNARDAIINLDAPVITIATYLMQPNAEFMRKHPAARNQPYACMSVADNGSGIDDKDIPQVFEPFFTTKEVGKGTGLGLAMVAGTIESHGGVVDVASIKESGTTFIIYLPLLDIGTDTDIDTDTGIDTDTDITGNGRCVLLVDDEPILRMINREILEALGYHVVEAIDGIDSIDKFKKNQQHISLVIMDVVMPKMGGVKAAERIRELSDEVPIIFATGYDPAQVLGQREQELTHSAIITKPFDILVLQKLIDEMI